MVRPIPPDPIRLEMVDDPRIPPAEVVCASGKCWSDLQVAWIIEGYKKALDEANEKLSWLREYLKAEKK